MDKNVLLQKIGTKVKPSKDLPIPVETMISVNSKSVVTSWARDENDNFYPVKSVATKLDRGIYEIKMGFSGVYFSKVNLNHANKRLLDFSNDIAGDVTNNINKFLSAKKVFDDGGFTYKKGILIFGGKLSGKSTTLYKIVNRFAREQGIVIKGGHPLIVKQALKYLESIESSTPVLVYYDNIDQTIESYGKEVVKDLIRQPGVIHLATVSSPEYLPSDIVKNVDLYDTIEVIKDLSQKDREVYLQDKLPKTDAAFIKSWAEKTKDFNFVELDNLLSTSIAHNASLEETIKRIKLQVSEVVEEDNTSAKKKVLKTFHLDKDGNLAAMVEQQVDDVIFVQKD